jgi:hypothetical protein
MIIVELTVFFPQKAASFSLLVVSLVHLSFLPLTHTSHPPKSFFSFVFSPSLLRRQKIRRMKVPGLPKQKDTEIPISMKKLGSS